MKKFLFIAVCCLCLCGCENKENRDLLLGDWSFSKTEIGETVYSYFSFNNDNTFKYNFCAYRAADNGCANGEAEFSGTYTLKDNVLKLIVTDEKQITDRYNSNVLGPSNSYIIDFNNMYFCDRNNGLDCKEKYEKDTK